MQRQVFILRRMIARGVASKEWLLFSEIKHYMISRSRLNDSPRCVSRLTSAYFAMLICYQFSSIISPKLIISLFTLKPHFQNSAATNLQKSITKFGTNTMLLYCSLQGDNGVAKRGQGEVRPECHHSRGFTIMLIIINNRKK